MPSDLKAIMKLEVPLIVEIGRRRMTVAEVTALAPGAIIELPKPAEDELEVLVNFIDEPVEVPGVSGRWVGGTARPGETPGPGQGLGPDEARILDPRG